MFFFKGLDFETLNPCVDFYLFSLSNLNYNCSPELRMTGLAPLTGSADYTMVRQNKIISNRD